MLHRSIGDDHGRNKQNENIFEMNDNIFFEWVSLPQKADLIKFAKKSTQ